MALGTSGVIPSRVSPCVCILDTHLLRPLSRPFRVSWTDFNQDHLQVTVNTHFNLAPLGDAYWNTRQAVLMAIARAVKKHGIQLAQMYSFATSGSEPEWRVLPKRSFTRVRAPKEDEGEGTTNGSSETNRSESDTLTD